MLGKSPTTKPHPQPGSALYHMRLDWSSAHGFAVSPPIIKDKDAARPKADSSRVLGTANAGTGRYLLNVCRELGDADSASHPGQGGTQGRGPENHEGRESKKGGRKAWEEAASSISVAEAGWKRSCCGGDLDR